MSKQHLATITILISDRQQNSEQVNRLLTKNGRLVMSRLGVNVQRKCLKNCLALMVVAVSGTIKEINDLTKEINKFVGVQVKNNIMTK